MPDDQLRHVGQRSRPLRLGLPSAPRRAMPPGRYCPTGHTLMPSETVCVQCRVAAGDGMDWDDVARLLPWKGIPTATRDLP